MDYKMSNIFQITGWDESPYIEKEDGSKKSLAKITQHYSGVIEGSGEPQYLMSYQSAASAVFVGFEVVTVNLVVLLFSIMVNSKMVLLVVIL
jgi:hypothetical protein